MMLRVMAVLGLVVIMGIGMAGGAAALFIEKPLEDPAEEARAQRLMKELRCLVCQNQAISESNAGLAQDLRVLLRERLAAGDTDRQAMDFMVARYGDWVLLDPPVKSTTYILWAGPALTLLIGVGILIIFLRGRGSSGGPGAGTGGSRRQAPRGAVALNDDERAELDELLMQAGDDNRDNKGA